MNNFGLNNTYDYYEFTIDSLENSGAQTSGESPLNWPSFFIGGKVPMRDVVALKVLSAAIPFSYYVFTNKNNTFQVSVNHTTWVDIVIPVGNYTADTMQATLQSLITAAIGATTVTYSQSTMKYTFVKAAIYFKFPLGGGLDNPRLWIGFNAGVQGDTGSFTTPNAVLLSGPNYLYINSASYGQVTNHYRPQGASEAGNTGPQMAYIPITTDSENIICYRDPGLLFFNYRSSKIFLYWRFHLVSKNRFLFEFRN